MKSVASWGFLQSSIRYELEKEEDSQENNIIVGVRFWKIEADIILIHTLKKMSNLIKQLLICLQSDACVGPYCRLHWLLGDIHMNQKNDNMDDCIWCDCA